MSDETKIEAEIQAKGLTAPRLTPDDIDEAIVSEDFHVFPGTTLTVCALTLRNGFIVTGESASASPENFDAELGRKIARSNARNKIWAFEGYALREKIWLLGEQRKIEAEDGLEPWQRRVVNEHRVLDKNLRSLCDFLKAGACGVSEVDHASLAEQRDAMASYKAALEARISRF